MTTHRAINSRKTTSTTSRPSKRNAFVTMTLTALKALIVRTGGLREGRKSIIVITEGFTNVLLRR